MTMLGRNQDKLYHILVNPPFDQQMKPPFYFPEKGVTHILTGKDGKKMKIKSETAELTLSELPFICTRYRWEKDFKYLPADYSEATDKINNPVKIMIDLTHTELTINGAYFFVRDIGDQKRMNGAQTLLVLYILYHCKEYKGYSGIESDALPNVYRGFFRAFQKYPKVFHLEGTEEITSGRISRLFSEFNKKAAKKGISVSFVVERGLYGIPDTVPLETIEVKPLLPEEKFLQIAKGIRLDKLTHNTLSSSTNPEN